LVLIDFMSWQDMSKKWSSIQPANIPKIAKAEGSKKMLTKCSKCKTKIQVGKEYNDHSKILCEDCYVDVRMPRVRKTHWQYLGSIKTEYLRFGEKD